jgi:3-isopropylmalate dehydrogenase
MAQARKILNWLDQSGHLPCNMTEHTVGGASIDAHGVPVTDDAIAAIAAADAALMGAVGGPQWDNVAYDIRPEAGLLKLRKELDLFANLRPAIVFDALIEASSLKPEIIRGLDILIVRELTSGVYFGEPRGIEDLGDGKRRGVNTQSYTSDEIRRIGCLAFEMARKRKNHVHSADKANVMESGRLWRDEITALHDAEYSDVALDHIYADNCAMQLLRAPRQFDVIVTDNLFGDMLSDEAAMLTGSLGMLPSASLGEVDSTGKRPALYEPVHGSAPDIAGEDCANPCAMLLSLAMLLRYSLNRGDLAEALEKSVMAVLDDGVRTPDIMAANCREVGTDAMGNTILEAFKTRI